MKPQQRHVTILMASNYTYGPPLPLNKKRIWVQDQVSKTIEILNKEGFLVKCRITGEVDRDGRFTIEEDDWNKICKFELLDVMIDRGLATRDADGNFRLSNTRDQTRQFIEPNFIELFDDMFSPDNSAYDAKAEIDFYERDLDERVKNFVIAAESQIGGIIFNCGGGNMGERHLPKRLSDLVERGFSPNPTIISGFSDGTYLPFFFIDKNPNIILVEMSGLSDVPFLKGEKATRIKLKAVTGSQLPSTDIVADSIAISLHTSYNQIFDKRCVNPQVFEGKVVMIESAKDDQWKAKIFRMIDDGVFDNSKAVILGEFSQAIKGEMFKQKIDMQESLVAEAKQNFFVEFEKKLRARRVEIPILESEEDISFFGHGSRRLDAIPCGKCTISAGGEYVSLTLNELITSRTAPPSVSARSGERVELQHNAAQL